MFVTLALEAAVLLAVGTLLLSIYTQRADVPLLVRVLVYSAVVGHFTLGCLMQYGGVASDAAGYHADAIQLSGFWAGERAHAPTLTDGKAGWAWTLGILYSILSPNIALGIAINAVLVGAAPLQMFRITRGLLDETAARRAAVLIWFLPAGWLWGSLPLREATITFLLLAALQSLIKAARGQGPQWWLALGTALGLLILFRGSMAIIVIASALAAVLLVARGDKWTLGSRILIVPAAVVLATLGQFALDLGGSDLSVERVSAIQQSQSSSANSRFEVEAAPNSFGDIVTSLPTALPRATLGPYPWSLGEIPVPLLADAVFWWVVLALAVIGFRRTKSKTRRDLVALLLVPLLGLLIALAVYSGNYGTMIRIRATGAIYLIPFAAVAFAGARAQSRQRSRRRGETGTGQTSPPLSRST